MAPHPYLMNTALSVALVPLALGFNALLRPASALAIMGAPMPKEPDARKLTTALMSVYGARNFAIGLTGTAIWYYGNVEAMGWLSVGGTIMMLVDGQVMKDVTGSGEWRHWCGVPIAVGLAIGLLTGVGGS